MEKIGSTVDSPTLSKAEEDFWVLSDQRFEVGLRTEEIEKMYQIVQENKE